MILRLLALPMLALLTIAPAHAIDYNLRSGKIAFAGTQQGEAFNGEFKRFTSAIQFDTKQFATGKFDVSIDLASATTQNTERDDALRSADFFAVERFPKARFVTSTMTQTDPTHFVAEATLTIRDKTVAVKFPFSFEAMADGSAKLKGHATLDRLAFDLGAGEWADATMIGHEVKVDVELELTPKP